MSSSLDFQGVSRNFGNGEVLRDISLCVPASRCVALLGASGSGKSTLLRIASGLDTRSTGRVLVDGQDLDGVPAEEREISLVFQKPLLFPHLTVLDNVAFAARMAGLPRKIARSQALSFLELVQLESFARRMPGQLSGGQEQRVSLARALARTPRILLLDEPFSSLDFRLREDMYALLENIRSQLEPTIVLVTHDRREASVLADTIAVLDEGRILQHGLVPQLHYQPVSRAVNRIMGGLNELPGVITDGFHSSALGRVRVQQGVPDGPAILLIRQEAIRISSETAGAASGTVTAVRSMGAHVLVQVRVESARGSGSIAVEMAGALAVGTGDRVGVTLPDSQGWAVTA